MIPCLQVSLHNTHESFTLSPYFLSLSTVSNLPWHWSHIVIIALGLAALLHIRLLQVVLGNIGLSWRYICLMMLFLSSNGMYNWFMISLASNIFLTIQLAFIGIGIEFIRRSLMYTVWIHLIHNLSCLWDKSQKILTMAAIFQMWRLLKLSPPTALGRHTLSQTIVSFFKRMEYYILDDLW